MARDQVLAERFLERTIGRMIDVNYHVITEMGGAPPKDYFDSFVVLAPMGILRIAYEYDQIDPAKLYEGLRKAVEDIPTYLGHLQRFLDRFPGE